MYRYLLPRLQDFLFVLIFVGALFAGPRMLNTDSDLGRQLTLGRYILTSHEIPTRDLLSYTRAGESRPPYEWLAQVLLATADRILGLDGVVLLTSVVIASALTLAYKDAVDRTRAPFLALFIAAWAATASSIHWLSRPHIFSFLFFAIWISWLERLRRAESIPLWLFPGLMLVWANAHGGFIFGFLAYAAYLAGWVVSVLRKTAGRPLGRQLVAVGATSLIASVLTPALWHNWEAILNNRSRYILSRTVETMPLQAGSPGVWPFLLLLALSVLLLLLRRMQAPAAHLFLLGGLAALSFVVVRNIPFFAIAAIPVLTEWAAGFLNRFEMWRRLEERFAELDHGLRGRIWPATSVMMAIVLFAVWNTRAGAPLFQFRQDVFPVRAVDWVVAHPPPGRMFNDFNWGGYLLYRLWPAQKVFIDSQSDFYGEALTRQAAEIAQGAPGWEAVLDQFHVGWMLLPRSAGLAETARLSPHWGVVYEDMLAVVLVRR